MNTKYVYGGVVLAILLSVFTLVRGGTPGPQGPAGTDGLTAGAVSSPALGPWFSVGDVRFFGGTSGLNNASTTLCAIQSPAATSTLLTGSLTITTASSSAIAVDIYRLANRFAATSTGVALGATQAVGANGKLTAVASSSPISAPFAPNEWFVARYTNGSTPGATGPYNTLVGACKAVWTEL